MCSLARFDLANRGVSQPVQPHTFFARMLIFDKTSAQPHFAVVNCSGALMNVFYIDLFTKKEYSTTACRLINKFIAIFGRAVPNVANFIAMFVRAVPNVANLTLRVKSFVLSDVC